MASLYVTAGPLAGRRISVDERLSLGRVDADLTIDDPLVSRRHAEIRPVDGALEIEDQGSLNGTWVNGQRIAGARRLAPGDVVRIGSTEIEVEPEIAQEGGTVLAPVLGDLRGAPSAPPREAEPSGAEPPRRPRAAGDAGLLAGQEDEVRPVTALFADVVGSTTLGERLAAHEVKTLVGECVSRMTATVEQFGGTVQAYMGDGIAAFFGVPAAHEDDAERAARAALQILDVLAEYARDVEAAWGIPDFNARVGINTGETAVGLVGAAAPQSVSLGDTTNVAARLQSVAEPGTVAIGEATAKALVHRFVLEPLGDVQVKGRVKTVSAWRLVGPQAAQGVSAEAPLVGRETEVRRITALLEDVTAGRGQMLLLIGDSGIGKTRLLAELRSLAGGRTTWLEGHCLSYGTDRLYGPFIQMLRTWIGAEDGEAELAVRTKLRAKLGLLPASKLPAVLPYLARLLSLKLDPDDEEKLRGLSPESFAAEVRRAYRTWLKSLAGQGPVVLAIEDLHWADASTRELAEGLLNLVDVAPLLLVGTTRVEPTSEGWALRVSVLAEYAHRATELSLGPLSDDAARQLLQALPRSRDVKPEELEQIVAGAEGNPLYLEELLNAFAEDTGLRRGRTWAPTLTGGRALTPTLESLLLARIDRLPSSARRLAQVAAVVGRSFPLRVLRHIVHSEDLDDDLGVLLRADIIRELKRYPELEYVFRHGLLREASLSTLPPARRRELYRSVGAAFETLFGDSLDDHLEVVANYFARSDDPAKALAYLERAGERAAGLSAGTRATELWTRAVDVAQKLGDEGAVTRVRERLAGVGGRHPGGPGAAGERGADAAE